MGLLLLKTFKDLLKTQDFSLQSYQVVLHDLEYCLLVAYFYGAFLSFLRFNHYCKTNVKQSKKVNEEYQTLTVTLLEYI